MPARTDGTSLQLGDSILIETNVDQLKLALRGKLSNLLPKVVWVNVAEPGCPPLVRELREGHPVRISAARDGAALVGDTSFISCLGTSRRLVAVQRPAELKLIDRRAHLRVAVRRSVGVRLARDSTAGEGGHFAIGTSCDVSLSGMSFESTINMAVGDHVFVTLVLDQDRPLYALARIVRLDDAKVEQPAPARRGGTLWLNGRRVILASVKWDAMSPRDRERLQRFLVHVDRAVG